VWFTVIKNGCDVTEDVKKRRRTLAQKFPAKSVEPGRVTFVLSPSHLWLTIHTNLLVTLQNGGYWAANDCAGAIFNA